MKYIVGTGSELAPEYGVSGFPHAFIISRDGKLAWEGNPSSEDFDKQLIHVQIPGSSVTCIERILTGLESGCLPSPANRRNSWSSRCPPTPAGWSSMGNASVPAGGRPAAKLDRAGRLQFLDLHTRADAIAQRAPGLTPEAMMQAMQLITPSREGLCGLLRFSAHRPAAARPVALVPLLYLPGASRLGPLIYQWMAHHRYGLQKCSGWNVSIVESPAGPRQFTPLVLR